MIDRCYVIQQSIELLTLVVEATEIETASAMILAEHLKMCHFTVTFHCFMFSYCISHQQIA